MRKRLQKQIYDRVSRLLARQSEVRRGEHSQKPVFICALRLRVIRVVLCLTHYNGLITRCVYAFKVFATPYSLKNNIKPDVTLLVTYGILESAGIKPFMYDLSFNFLRDSE